MTFHPLAFQAVLKALESIYTELDAHRIHAPNYSLRAMLTRIAHYTIEDWQRYHPFLTHQPSTWEREIAIEAFRLPFLQKDRRSPPRITNAYDHR